MWKSLALLLCMSSAGCWAGPVGAKRNMPIVMEVNEPKIAVAYPLKKEEVAADAEQQAVTTQEAMYMSTLTLPSNATSIRADITDNFSCENKTYGYYADVENDCQIFHVCLPVTYADGKENTFRWSFICPEETIFSQDSFTCMRPEDMTIDCEESAQYYELNRNFGMVEDESNKNNAESAATKPALNEPLEADIPQVAPVAEVEAEKPEMESAPMMSMPMKPIKAKPNRRKPAHSSFSMQHKLTASHPLRKIPAPEVVAAPVVEAEEVKPAVTEKPKFAKRPVSMNNRDKVVPTTSSPPIRTELFNQNRKRPAYLNRKENVPKPATEEMPIVVAEESHVVEPVVVEIPEEPVMAVEEATADAEQSSAEDTDTQASETAAIFVKPQETEMPQEVEMTQEAEKIEEVEQPQEAEKIEEVEQPQEAEKMQEVEMTQEAEKIQEVAMPQEAEKVQEVEQPQEAAKIQEMEMTEEAEKSQEIEKPQEVEMPQKAEKTSEIEQPQEIEMAQEVQAVEAMPVEVNAELSPVMMEKVEEPLPAQAKAQPEPEKETPIVEEPQMVESDAVKPMEAIEEMPAVVVEAEETANEVSPSAPVASAEETAVDSVAAPEEPIAIEETMPLDTLPAMPATGETEQADANEPQMLVHQSVGGFKPVDSAMAAEAEALITDFINSLRKTDSIPSDDSANNDVPVETLGEPDLFRLYSGESEATAETHSNEQSEVQQEDTKVPKIGEDEEEDKKPIEVNDSAEHMEQVAGNLKTVEAMNPMEAEKDAEAPSEVVEKASSENAESKEEIPEPVEVSAALNAMPVAEEMVDASEQEKAPEPQMEVDTKTEEKPAEMAEPSEQSEAEAVAEEVKESPKPIATEVVAEPQMANEQPMQTPEVAETSNNMLMMQQYPSEMMQIPVQIIEAPMEEIQQSLKTMPVDEVPKEESAPETMAAELPVEKEIIPEAVAAPQMPLSLPHHTLSIDDIVELVKERLDQLPSGEKGIPMQMVMESGEQPAANELKETGDQAKPQSADEEVIVMPIYHRVAEPEPEPSHEALKLLSHEPQIHEQNSESIETVQKDQKEEEQPQPQSEESPMTHVSGGEQLTEETETPVAGDTVASDNEKQPESAHEAMEVPSMKISRSIRARSIHNAAMDPRKRRFLFRSDVN